jgi:hypothetical protein
LKSRIVIWTVVGVAALAGVIFLVSAPKAAGKAGLSLDTVKRQAVETEAQLDRLAARVVEVRKAPAPGIDTAKTLGEAELLLAQAREILAELKQATSLKQAEPMLVEAKQGIRKARRALQLASPRRAMPGGF